MLLLRSQLRDPTHRVGNRPLQLVVMFHWVKSLRKEVRARRATHLTVAATKEIRIDAVCLFVCSIFYIELIRLKKN